MDLKNYITESLLQLMDGIKDAQDKISTAPIPENDKKYFGAYIAPTPLNLNKNTHDNFEKIEFDIALTVSKDSTATGKLKISVMQIDFEGRSQSVEEKNSSVSRMKFSIPVIYPSMPKQHGT
jgi:hypothetical protein